MALDDRQHVEAVAIMRQLVEGAEQLAVPEEVFNAADQWLEENHPAPAVYMAALAASSPLKEKDGPA